MTEAILTGRNAIIYSTVSGSSAEVGYCKGWTIKLTRGAIKDYKIGSDKPAKLASGNVSATFTLDRFYTQTTWASRLYTGEEVDFEVRPSGDASAAITLVDCVLTAVNQKGTQDSLIYEDVAGEAESVTFV